MDKHEGRDGTLAMQGPNGPVTLQVSDFEFHDYPEKDSPEQRSRLWGHFAPRGRNDLKAMLARYANARIDERRSRLKAIRLARRNSTN